MVAGRLHSNYICVLALSMTPQRLQQRLCCSELLQCAAAGGGHLAADGEDDENDGQKIRG